MPSLLELGQQAVRGEVDVFPAGRLVGLVMKAVEPGRAVFELKADSRHHNPLGKVHGGIYCDLADAAMGWAFAASMPEGETFTTIELKINYLRAVKDGTITAEARVVKSGSTLGYIECEVTDEQGRLVAKASSTCLRLKAKA